ncbi:hypothetical protein [Paludifilum halophilum]|uniref:Uncharacterized protein n=1 Tax=Paludifilum halophilum TaxID=1642702 RepID=A0A235B321_9BACL|nr:hypothetical protein [Paludifilum halophilum]OYD06015.1 hypothetical protein CHM34_18595 [Paludifilum halophilum]
MDNFVGIIQTLNEKNKNFTQCYPDKATKVENRLASRLIINLGQYTLQKRARYVIEKSVQSIPLCKRQIIESLPIELAAKKKKSKIGIFF